MNALRVPDVSVTELLTQDQAGAFAGSRWSSAWRDVKKYLFIKITGPGNSKNDENRIGEFAYNDVEYYMIVDRDLQTIDAE